MVNEERKSVVKATLADGEMLALLNTAGIKPVKASPLGRISGQPAAINARNLQQAGLVDGAGRPTTAFTEALNILANPASEIDLLWGNPDGISLSSVYAAAGKDQLVAFTNMNGSNNISYFLSPQDITDLLVQRLAFSEIKNIAALDFEAAPAAVPAFFAVLDIYREEQLKAALERRQEAVVTVTAEEVNRVIQEAKLETNFSWYSPVAYNSIPLDFTITEATAEEGLSILKKEGLIGAGGELSESLNAFAYRAFPVAGFFGVKVITVNNAAPEKTQLALFRGISTLLLAQLTTENGVNRVLISSISTSQLPELLFNLSTKPFEVPVQTEKTAPAPTTAPTPAAAPANTVFCSKCGTKNDAKAKFCIKCGATLATTAAPAGPKFCPKCGDPVTANEKFCDKCGTPIK